MVDYPTTLSSQAVGAMFDGNAPLPRKVRAIYSLIGFGLGQALPDTPPTGPIPQLAPVAQAQVRDLEAAFQAKDYDRAASLMGGILGGGSVGLLKNLPWDEILKNLPIDAIIAALLKVLFKGGTP